MSDDFGDVGDFEKPQLEDTAVEALTNLIIDEGESSTDRIAEDIDDLIEAVGMERMQILKDYLMRDNSAESLCRSPIFQAAVARRANEFREALASIDFSDTGDL